MKKIYIITVDNITTSYECEDDLNAYINLLPIGTPYSIKHIDFYRDISNTHLDLYSHIIGYETNHFNMLCSNNIINLIMDVIEYHYSPEEVVLIKHKIEDAITEERLRMESLNVP